jgi:hypothetical protein
VSIDILYKWRSKPHTSTFQDLDSINGQDSFDSANPFSSQLLLPFQSILDKIVEKFVSVHLVKYVLFFALEGVRPFELRRRYPLIFGVNGAK